MDEPTSMVLLAYGDTRSILRSSYRTYLYIPVLVIRLSQNYHGKNTRDRRAWNQWCNIRIVDTFITIYIKEKK